MTLVGFLCVRGWQLRLQIPLLILGQGLGRFLPTEALAGCREGILGRFLWKPEWLTRAREELSHPELPAWEGRGAALKMAPVSWAGACLVGAFGPTQMYLSVCSGFSKQPVGFPNPSPHPASYVLAPS